MSNSNAIISQTLTTLHYNSHCTDHIQTLWIQIVSITVFSLLLVFMTIVVSERRFQEHNASVSRLSIPQSIVKYIVILIRTNKKYLDLHFLRRGYRLASSFGRFHTLLSPHSSFCLCLLPCSEQDKYNNYDNDDYY